MKVQVKLYGLLRLRTKNYDSNKGVRIDIKKGALVKELLNGAGIDLQEVGCIFINGNNITNFEVHLEDGDIIKIFSRFPSGG